MHTPHVGRARAAGLAAGLLLCGALVLTNAVPRGEGRLGAAIDVVAAASGELSVSPAGVVLGAPSLSPGDSADGAVEVFNQTGTALRVRVHGLPSTAQLDDLVELEVRAGSTPMFHGSLRSFRSWSEGSFVLASGAGQTLSLRAWLPATVTHGFEGRVEQIALEFSVEAAS